MAGPLVIFSLIAVFAIASVNIEVSASGIANAKSPLTETKSSEGQPKDNDTRMKEEQYLSGNLSLIFGPEDLSDDDGPNFTLQTFITIFVTVMIVITNCTIMVVAAWTEAFGNFNKTFVYSLTLADLLIGLFITPYSIFLSVYRKWVFTSELFCSVEAYAFTVLTMAKMYSLTWLSVDHYVAVRKPERYDVMMSPARSLCWITFSWMVAISYCCPLLFSFESAIFSESTFVCMVDSTQKIAYTLTSWILASLPSVTALGVTNAYLFTNSFKRRIQFYEKVFFDLSSRPRNYHMTFVMCAVFVISWFPFIMVFFVKEVAESAVNDSVQFYFFWLGVSSSFAPFFVLLLMSADFRYALWDTCQFPELCSECCGDSDSESIDINVITLPKKR